MHKGTSALESQNAIAFFTVLLLSRLRWLESPCCPQQSLLESSGALSHPVSLREAAFSRQRPTSVPARPHLRLRRELVWQPEDSDRGSPLLRRLWRIKDTYSVGLSVLPHSRCAFASPSLWLL